MLVFDFVRFGVELTGDTLIELMAALKFCESSLFGYDGDIHDGCVTCCCTCQIQWKSRVRKWNGVQSFLDEMSTKYGWKYGWKMCNVLIEIMESSLVAVWNGLPHWNFVYKSMVDVGG